MSIDFVESPVRYRRAPIVLLAVATILPAVALGLAYRWLDREADAYDDSRPEVPQAERPSERNVEPDAVEDSAPPDRRPASAAERRLQAVLDTSVLDFRRIPRLITRGTSAAALGADVSPVFGFLNDESCAAVAVEGVEVASVNAMAPVLPASVMKLLVASVALEVLGPEHRFVTTVASSPPIDGVVEGDVYLIGGGDPHLTSDDFPIRDDDPPVAFPTSLDLLADAFVAQGVERIRGRVVADATRYDDEGVVDSWGPGVAFDSAGPISALMVNDGRRLGRTSVDRDANESAARELRRLLSNREVGVSGGVAVGPADPSARVIGTVESVPLSAIVTHMLRASDNNSAEMLLKEIGVVAAGSGTRGAGVAVVRDTLVEWGVPIAGVRIIDGSGLSLDNRLTCDAVLAVLTRVRDSDVVGMLPAAGVSGTLRDEFLQSPMAGRLRAKTGTLGNPPIDEPPPAVKSLAGFVVVPDEIRDARETASAQTASTETGSAETGGTETGSAETGGTGTGSTETGNGVETIEFVIILNAAEVTPSSYRALWDAFGDRFATYPSGPVAAELGPR